MYLPHIDPHDPESVRQAFQKINAGFGPLAKPTWAGITLTGLTASALVGADTNKALESVTIGTGLDYTRPTISLSHLGIENLSDPGADRIIFWDDGETACKWLACGNSVAITTTTLDTIQDIRTSASPTFAGLTLTGLSGVLKASAGVVAGSATLDDVADGTSYERVAANQLNSGIYIDATTTTKGIASFSSTNFAVTSGAVSLVAGGGLNHSDLGNLDYASAGHTGFEPTVTKGNLTETTSSVLTITGGTGAVIGSGTTIQVAQAASGTDGYLSGTDWDTFNSKQAGDAGLTSLAGLTYVSDSFIKMTAADTYAVRTIAETKTDLSLNLVENTALSTWAGTSNITTLGTIATGTWQATDVGIAYGGTGQSTAQTAIDALTQVSAATNEHVLTKDTTTGNAIFKAGVDEKVKIDAAATAGYLGAASNDGVLRTTTGLSYTDGGDFATLGLSHLGIESLSDPNADKIVFWDDGETACKWLAATEGVQISGTDLKLDINGLTADASPVGSTDYVVTYDATASGHKKVLLDNFHRYVNRGDPASADRELGDLTTDGAWHDLDLGPSGLNIVPAKEVLVNLSLSIKDNVTNSLLQFRKNGNSNTWARAALRTLEADIYNDNTAQVMTDSNGVIEYYATNTTWTAIYITVCGWWLP